MKMKNLKKRFLSAIMAVSILSGSIAGCGDAQTSPASTTMPETESSSSTEKSAEKATTTAAPAVERATIAETTTAEAKDLAFTKEKEELIKSLEGYLTNFQTMKASTERDIYDFFLNTLQVYYEACGNYATEEGTIGDLITSNVADSLSGGSSTISSSIQAAAKSIQKNGVTGELVTDTFAAAMEELPKEIVSKLMEYLLGGTIMKALDILKAAIPQNEQSQHLVNMIDYDIKKDINALSFICQSRDLTAEDCYMGGILIDSIIRKCSTIERMTGINAGSFAWSPTQGKSWVSMDLSSAAYAIRSISIYEEIIAILNTMEEPPKTSENEYKEFQDAFEQITRDSIENYKSSELGLLQTFDDLGRDINGAYDAEDAEARSKATNLMNSVNMVIGNPITDIFVYSKNAEEKVFADALFSYNAEVIPLWKERYVPLAAKTEQIVETMNTFSQMFTGASPWTDVSSEMKIAMTKAFFGGLPSMEPFDTIMSDIASELTALSAQTSILKSAYRFALTDSQTNTAFMQNYEWVDDMIRRLCICTRKISDAYDTGFQSDDAVQKTAEASRNLIQTYVKSIDKRDDLYTENSTYQTAACGTLTYIYIYKRPGNGVSTPTICYIKEKKEGDEFARSYYFLGNSQHCYWVTDKNRSYLGFPGYYPFGAGTYFREYPEQITEEIWRPVLFAEHGEAIEMKSGSSNITQKDMEWLAEDLDYCLTADVAAAQKEQYESIEHDKQYNALMEAYETKIAELSKKVEAGEEQWLLDPEKVAISFMTYYLEVENPKLLRSEYTPAGEFIQEGMKYEFEGDEASGVKTYTVYLNHPDFLEPESPIWTATGFLKDKQIGDFSIEKYMKTLREP